MTGVLYGDIVATSISKLQGLLDARQEAYAADVKVSNKVIAGVARMVTIEYAGGPGDTDTLDDTFEAVNVYGTDEADCNDLTRMVRALYTGRGVGTMCDGLPITHTALNTGASPILNGTSSYQFRMVFQVQHRGVNL
ncbi:MAG TPA: hypothetical protein VGM94_04960 [Galbitalea sp.]|jgi:hypothetical protein